MRSLFFFTLLAIAAMTFSEAQAYGVSSPTFPQDYIYFECGKKNCTDSELRNAIATDVYARGPGAYTYVAGNIATGNIFIVNAKLMDLYGGEPGYPTRLTYFSSEESVSPEVEAEFRRWASVVRQFDFELDFTPPSPSETVPTVPHPDDIGARTAIQNFINSHPTILSLRTSLQNAGRAYMVTITFEDGSSGRYVVHINLSSINVVPYGDFVDADGNRVHADAEQEGEPVPVTIVDDTGGILNELIRYVEQAIGWGYVTAGGNTYKCVEGPDKKIVCEIVEE